MMIAKLKHWRLHRLPVIRLVIGTVLSLLQGDNANAQAPSFPAATQPVAAQPAIAGESKVEAYPLTASTRDVLTRWQQQTAGRTDIRVAIDERTAQALVFAPPAVHAQIQQQLAATMRAAVVTPAQTPIPTTTPSVGLNIPGGAVLFQLRQMPAAEVHSKLESLLSCSLPATVDASGDWQSFPIEITPGAAVTMSVNIRAGQVRLDGPPAQVAAWRSVIEALDSPPLTPDRVTQLVATKPTSHDRVRKALQVLQADSAARPSGSASLISTIFQPQNSTVADTTTQLAAGQPPAAQSTPAAGQPAPGTTTTPAPTTQVAPGGAQTAIDAARLAEAAGGLLGPVQVEFVEGLDVIVLRGSERDVQRVMDIIKQIEDLSAVTVPDIQIYELKYVDSVQMGALLQRLYEQVLGPRIGTVSITPLGKPNALLLIGRPENVKMAIELIQRLDQPVVPTSRFEVFPLKHASATEAKTLIDGFLGQGADQGEGTPTTTTTTGAGAGGGTSTTNQIPTLAPRALVVADPRTNSLIVSASQRDIAEIAALVSRIDTPGAAAELKVFTIANGDATALRDMLSSLFSVPADSGGGGGDGAATSGGALGQGGPVRMQFSVDTRTNSIIAVGSREDLAVVEAILLRLDEGDLRERQTTVYRLNNAFSDNVAQALQNWLQTQRQNEQDTEIAISPFEQIEREVIIVSEAATNSLIVSATPRYYSEVVKVIKELDERPPMVLIQVMIAEVRLNDTDEFGVELGLQDSLLFDRSLVSDVQTLTTTTTNQVSGTAVTTEQQNIINANGNPGFNFNNSLPLGNNLSSTALATASKVAAQGLTSFSLNRAGDQGFGGFVFSASSNSVSILLRALQEKRRLEVLSRPQLMALDGQPGYVQVGQNVPRIVATNIDALGGQTNSITYEAVGLILQVVPRISPDGLVVMQITANKSEVGPEADGIPISVSNNGQVLRAPRIEITQALTTVSALGGQTVVLGGLLQTRKADVHRRVPIISDIPLIGDLFRYDSVSEERRELLIILTPQIIYNKMDSDLVKQIESSRMSYILSDVINLHGEAGLRSRCDEWYDGEMESIYPNVVPAEGVLPLSRGQLSPGGGPELCAPIYEEAVPQAPTTTPNGEALPQPNVRQSPASNRPINDRLTAIETSGNVTPTIYQEPPQPPTFSSP
jgi:type II secretion system protein D